VVPSVHTENRQSESGLNVTWLVATPKSDALLSLWLNKLTILPRFNRIDARRSSTPPAVSFPSFVNLRSSILISEFPDNWTNAPGINARLIEAPSDVRTVSPAWILLLDVTGWKLFRSALPKTTLPLTKNTVAAVARVIPFEHPFAHRQKQTVSTLLNETKCIGKSSRLAARDKPKPRTVANDQ
jgi:hypothetical protein